MYQPTLQIGDLVYHLIYGKEWIAVVLDLTEVKEKCIPERFCREYVLVHMQDGSKHEVFFRRATNSTRVNDRRGLISYHWLRKVADEGILM